MKPGETRQPLASIFLSTGCAYSLPAKSILFPSKRTTPSLNISCSAPSKPTTKLPWMIVFMVRPFLPVVSRSGPFEVMLNGAQGIILGRKARFRAEPGDVDTGVDVHRRLGRSQRPRSIAQVDFRLRERFSNGGGKFTDAGEFAIAEVVNPPAQLGMLQHKNHRPRGVLRVDEVVRFRRIVIGELDWLSFSGPLDPMSGQGSDPFVKRSVNP